MQEPYEIRQLRYFLEVADAGSFSRAAKRLGVSQPAVSQQMRDLEASLRVTLFQRHGKRISLTSAGLVFQEHCRAILRQIEKSLQELGEEPGDLRGTLRLGVIPYLNVALMPRLLGLFAREHPRIDVSILEISSSEIETLLEEGTLDAGLGWVTRHSPNLHYEHLGDDELHVVVSESHPWAKRRSIELSELHRQPLLQLPDSYVMRRMIDELFRNHRVRPRTVAEVNSIEVLQRSLEPLQAIALMPKICLTDRAYLKLKAIRVASRSPELEIGLLRLIDSRTNSSVAAFVKLATEVLPEMIRQNRA